MACVIVTKDTTVTKHTSAFPRWRSYKLLRDVTSSRFPLVFEWQMNLPNFYSNQLIPKRSSREWPRRQKDVCHLLTLLALVFLDFACLRSAPSLVLKILIPGCGWTWVLRSSFCLLPHKALRTIKTSILFCRIILVMLMLTMENGRTTRRMESWRYIILWSKNIKISKYLNVLK